jgi:ElaB/YqjD/DUF883 family membrane-anchored ribosome-binding protein
MEETPMATKSRKKSRDPVDTEQLYEHLQAVIRDSEALLKASASYAGDKIDVAKAQAAETLASAKERLSDVQDGILSTGREYVAQGDEYVRENPWQAVGFAALAGFIFGALLLRSRD